MQADSEASSAILKAMEKEQDKSPGRRVLLNGHAETHGAFVVDSMVAVPPTLPSGLRAYGSGKALRLDILRDLSYTLA